MMRRRCRSASSYDRDSAALDCRMSPSFGIRQLAWRLVCLRRQGSHATWPAKRVAKKLKVTETTSQKVSFLE
jgi:hypothetical protein